MLIILFLFAAVADKTNLRLQKESTLSIIQFTGQIFFHWRTACGF